MGKYLLIIFLIINITTIKADEKLQTPLWSYDYSGLLDSKAVSLSLRRNDNKVTGYLYKDRKDCLPQQVCSWFVASQVDERGRFTKVKGAWQIQQLTTSKIIMSYHVNGRKKLLELTNTLKNIPADTYLQADNLLLYNKGQLLQTIHLNGLDALQTTVQPLWMDVNFDGQLDLVLRYPPTDNAVDDYWDVYLYQPSTKRYVKSQAFNSITATNPSLDNSRQRVIVEGGRGMDFLVTVYQWLPFQDTLKRMDTGECHIQLIKQKKKFYSCLARPYYDDNTGQIKYVPDILHSNKVDLSTCEMLGDQPKLIGFISYYQLADKQGLYEQTRIKDKKVNCPKLPYLDMKTKQIKEELFKIESECFVEQANQ